MTYRVGGFFVVLYRVGGFIEIATPSARNDVGGLLGFVFFIRLGV